MTKDEAMKMALEALEVATTPIPADRQEVLAAMNALRQALEQPSDIDAAVLAEREACAKVCESLRDEDGYEAFGAECADAIRARARGE